MSNFNLPENLVHLGLLRKFQHLKNQTLKGKEEIKNLPPDELVPKEHFLHGLVRGFYKPQNLDYILSFLVMEKDDNYGRQIEWIDKEKGEFKRIVIKPPNSPEDPRANSDIEAGRLTMKKNVPVGILENVEKGVNRCLGLGIIAEENSKGNFIVKPINIRDEEIVNKIAEERYYLSIRTKTEDTVYSIIEENKKELEIGQIYINDTETTEGSIVFLGFGGNNPPWDTGLKAICTVIKSPYDHGYHPEKKSYFKIKVRIDFLFPKLIERKDLVKYRNCYDIAFIGPMTKGEPNQPNQLIPKNKITVLIRALLDYFPEYEDEMVKIFGRRLINNAKEETEILISQQLEHGQAPLLQKSEEKSTAEEWKPKLNQITRGMEMDVSPIINMRELINMNKNIILTGPPGTGKTTIAERACREAVRQEYISDYIVTTATADWTTFDTVGGYMPNKEKDMKFIEGAVLQSIRENSWLVIDEINRADIDRAFGQVFTILSGKKVTLPYENSEGKSYKIKFTDELTSRFDPETATYYIGQNWRILATMNTYDKNALFNLSYALMRRFAFVEIPIPDEDDIENLIAETSSDSEIKDFVKKTADNSPKSLGPAVLKDLAEYLDRAGIEQAVSGLISLVLPQFEGLARQELIDFYQDIGVELDNKARNRLKEFISSFFDISQSYSKKADKNIKTLNRADEFKNE